MRRNSIVVAVAFVLMGTAVDAQTSHESPTSETIVEALDCKIPVPASYQLRVSNAAVTFIDPRRDRVAMISIKPLSAEPLSAPSIALTETKRAGPLTFEKYVLASEVPRGERAASLILIKGLSQQVELLGVTGSEANRMFAACSETLDPRVMDLSNRKARGCKSTIVASGGVQGLLGGARAQAVIKGGGLSGLRIFQTDGSTTLKAQGVRDGDIITSICGVPVAEVMAAPDPENICCATSAADGLEATIDDNGVEKTIKLAPDYRIERTRER